ncbi:MAG: hypothetical protein VST71_09490 [Nitrospirota bacterium]|nr:hypothetical protein [Nitrospirota bacterium]
MDKKLTKIVGLKKDDFDEFISSGELKLRKARLLPFFKPGDEMALTSVILSSIRLINEFRKKIFSDCKLMGGGQIYVFTEVSFPQFPEYRVDGLLLIVKSGIIKDAAIFEMKNGNDILNKEQIEHYQEVAKAYSIPKLVTISNQFVSEPTQCPVNIKTIKNVDIFHFSWSYLLTIAHVLLFKNDANIEDADQVEIMREVVNYLEYDKSGVFGLNHMKAGWSETIEKINAGANLKINDPYVCDAVYSWQQEEKDMALILSRHLGVLVDSGETKYKSNLKARLEDDKKSLINKKQLVSTLRVKDAVSDIKIMGLLEKRSVEMFVSLKAPHDKTLRGQLGWIKRQIENCKKKNEAIFEKLKKGVLIETKIKNSHKAERMSILNFDEMIDILKNKEIKEFKIVLIKDFGKQFASSKKFVELIEHMLIDFYSGIIQYLYKWEPSAPKLIQPIEAGDPAVIEKPTREVIEGGKELKEIKT